MPPNRSGARAASNTDHFASAHHLILDRTDDPSRRRSPREDEMVVPSPWVWRHDGTLQCGLGSEETLDEARAQLETVIGAANVIQGEKRHLPGLIIQLCGAPTGQVNAFELTPAGFLL